MQKYCLSQNLNYLQSKYKNILKSEKIFIFYIRQKILFIKNHIRW